MQIVSIAMMAVVLSCADFAFAQATQPTTAPANLSPQQEQIVERLKLEADTSLLPKRQVDSLDQVIQFRRQGGQLVATSQLADVTEETRIIVKNSPAVIKFRPFVLNMGPGMTDPGFTFIMHDLSGPAPSHAITTVSVTAGRLTLARDVQQGDVSQSVQLIQNPPAAEPNPDEPTVSLYLSRAGTPGQDFSVRHTSNSFDDLCIRFADQANQYLRPVLRDFRQEANIFAPNAQLAWQALAADYVIEPAMLDRVNTLVTKLDADSYEERQNALAGLREIGQPAAIILMRADRAAMSPEKQSSVDEFLAQFIQLSPDEAKAIRDNPTFLLDVLTSDDVELRKLAWERLKQLTNTPVEFDPRGEDSERNAAIDKLRASVKK